VPRDAQAGVAFDVASSRVWKGAAEQNDVRYSTTIEVPELPWPLRFWFRQVQEDDGTLRWAVFGFELGSPLPREGLESRDPADIELTHERLALIWANFDRYRRMAEHLLIPAPWNVEKAMATRAAMGRRKGRAITTPYLAQLVAEWRARRGEPDLMYELAEARGISRVTLWRQLKEAERRGLVPEGLPRRRRA